MTSMNIVHFSRPLTPLVHVRPKFFHPLDHGRPISTELPPLQMITNQLKENMIQWWLLCVINKVHYHQRKASLIWSKSQKEDFLSIIYCEIILNQFSLIKKIKIGRPELLLPHPPTSDNISFLPYPPPSPPPAPSKWTSYVYRPLCQLTLFIPV